MNIRNLVVDIDGTICTNTNGKYEDAKPFIERIEQINRLYDAGYNIVYFTARGMGRYKNNVHMAEYEFYTLTKKQLDSWGCKYHDLRLGKPSADVYIDDKAVQDRDFFNYMIRNFKIWKKKT